MSRTISALIKTSFRHLFIRPRIFNAYAPRVPFYPNSCNDIRHYSPQFVRAASTGVEIAHVTSSARSADRDLENVQFQYEQNFIGKLKEEIFELQVRTPTPRSIARLMQIGPLPNDAAKLEEMLERWKQHKNQHHKEQSELWTSIGVSVFTGYLIGSLQYEKWTGKRVEKEKTIESKSGLTTLGRTLCET